MKRVVREQNVPMKQVESKPVRPQGTFDADELLRQFKSKYPKAYRVLGQ